ncbi:uncharacterized protein BJX67DRAFT_343838 [Aspergillus lucknowensis]|uniref:DUF7730 domain-containing protein n=1 Tax=Aspergillus lucknowensis TaxID=176173 RepID=A0ABR4M3Q8_9EURO
MKTESSFLTKLPLDIRLRIYRHVLSQGTVHFLEEKGYMFYVFCDEGSAHPTKTCRSVVRTYSPLRYWGMALDNISEFGWGNPYLPPDVVSRGEVPLLRVCRQVHAEALSVLYAGAVFQVDDLETWVRFAGHLGPEKLALVRSLRVDWYPDMGRQGAQGPQRVFKPGRVFWEIVATQMPGLRELAVDINYGQRTVLRDLDAEWHLPLHEVRGLQSFTLTISDAIDRKDGPVYPETVLLTDHLRQVMCSQRDEGMHSQPVRLDSDFGLRPWYSGWRSGYRTDKP